MIEIRRRSFGHYESYSYLHRQPAHFVEEYVLYVVVKDGKRIDAFLRRENAERKVAQLIRDELDCAVIALHTDKMEPQ